jgi:hypothetical protein
MNRPSNVWGFDGRAFKPVFSPPSGFEYRDEDGDGDGDEVEDEDEGNDESGRSNADELRLEDCDGCAKAVRTANTA